MILRGTVCSLYRKIFVIFHDFLPIIRNFFIYSSGALILRSTQLITTPITMSILSPSDYGMLALINSFISIGSALCGLGLRQVLPLEYFRGTKQDQQFLIKNIIVTYVTLIAPLFLIALWNHTIVRDYCLIQGTPTNTVVMSLVLIFLYFFTELIYQILQYEGKAWELTTLQVATAFLTIGLNLFLLIKIQLGIASVIISQFIGMLIVCGASIWYVVRSPDILCSISLNSFKKIRYYFLQGLPFLPSMLFGWMLAAGDRFVLARYATLHEVGIYSVADTFGQLFQMIIIIPFSYAYLPNIMRKFASKTLIMDIEATNRKIMWLFIPSSIATIILGYWLFKPLALWFLPTAYHPALTHVVLLLVGYVFLMASYFAAALIQFYKKSYFLSFALCVPALLNIALNILLVPNWGISGCVAATTISYMIYFAIMVWYNYRLTNRLHDQK